MMSEEDNSSPLTTDAVPLDFEKLKIPKDEEEVKETPKERRKSSTTKEPRRSSSHVMMNFVQSNGIHIGNTFNLVTSPQAAPDFQRSTSAYKKTQEIKDLISSKDVITKEDILWLSTHIGKGWRRIGALLNYSEGQIDQFEANYGRSNIREAIYRLLLDWKNSREEEEATVGIVSKAMWKAKECDAVQRWALRRGKPIPPSSA
ncbi:hypothetical protein J437_LFUL011259 [Ladona fulva]|uniref:Death domain-containing protein n=1 Tax=Ladona fulva TaxID=123851 RepID=A0A8K0P1P0_LADFU|nr:hypothetical protein J437_LFUL011259 [Ladona fulva]